MNEQNNEVNMNIPSAEPEQPQDVQVQAVQPLTEEPQTIPMPKAPAVIPVTNIHTHEQTKMSFLLALTIILGIVAVVSLVFALKMGGNPLNINFDQTKEETSIPKDTGQMPEEDNTPMQTDPTKLNPSLEVSEMDKLNLDAIENSYLDSSLEE